ncbi:actin associated protein isoform X2 [Zea mays]|uniref:Hydroxyproline-rich glycoprotein family protein n=1 Tax=Zea mays TaxID=4577 RepID=C0HG53_MAIZE|nr:actin associated protein isoform X2 [Zea mays]ACN26006.1 unknown [Zea mays]ONM18616.1 hydroxyproline-rich glycoprotein family protein [Zea mays]|eukprot:XP_008668047.1 actin associated protein isoform X2 [Zea mays]
MASVPHSPPVIRKSGNLMVFVTPPAEPESPRSEFSTPPTSPRAEESPESPPAQMAPPPTPIYSVSVSTPPLVKTVSPPLHAEKLSRPSLVQVPPPLVKTVSPPLPAEKLSRPPLVQVPPLQFAKVSAGSDGSLLAFFWDAVAHVQKAHSRLDKHISRWFGLDQSKYQWALNDYFERTGQEIDSSTLEHSCKNSESMTK